MATPSEVKTGLSKISETITQARQLEAQAKQQMLRAQSLLAQVPTDYSDVITTIDGYTPTGAFETLSKDEKAKLQTEFLALKTTLEGYLNSLGVAFS